MPKPYTRLLPLLLLTLTPLAHADLHIQSLDGPVTPAEIAAFKSTMNALDLRPDNNHNNFVYGKAGNAAEALGTMYEITHDPEILSQFIKLADMMLAARNDPIKGRILWTGNRDLTWPNSPDSTDQYLYAGEENGDILGHIAYCAKLILDDKEKSLYTQKLPDNTTYLDRAKHYITECDKTIDQYLLPNFVDPKTNLYTGPTTPLFARLGDRAAKSIGKSVPWNQQMMLNNGFQRLAECHALLNDDPPRVAQYDTIVKTSCTAFLKSLVHYNVDGHDCVKWSYAANYPTLNYMEDSSHGGYDLLLLRHYRSGRYGNTKDDLLPFANTIRYVLTKPDGTFATRVDGVSKGQPNKSLHTTYLPYSEFLPDLWPLIAPPELPRAKSDPLLTATLLSLKQYRNTNHIPHPPTNR